MAIMTRYIDKIIINRTKAGDSLGLAFDHNGECMMNFHFEDGYAIEVDVNGNHVRPENDPIILFYPTMNNVLVTPWKKEAVEEYINRPVAGAYDIALKFGFPMRFSTLSSELKTRIKENFIPEEIQWYIQCCPNYAREHPEIKQQLQEFFKSY